MRRKLPHMDGYVSREDYDDQLDAWREAYRRQREAEDQEQADDDE